MPGELKLTDDMKRALAATRTDPEPGQGAAPAVRHYGAQFGGAAQQPQAQPPAQPQPQSYTQPQAQPQAQPQPVQAQAQPQPAQPQPQAQPTPAFAAPQQPAEPQPKPSIATDFVTEKEHPVCPMPFTVKIGEDTLEGAGLSLTHAYVRVPVTPDDSMLGTKHLAHIQFVFDGFQIDLTPEVLIARGRDHTEVALEFADPTGPHLPQLRYVINSFIAGDFVTLGSFLSYTGPVTPKSPKAKAGEAKRSYLKSAGVIAVSLLLIAVALNIVTQRYIHAYEPRPVFIAQAGQEMRSTSPGQITYLNTEAGMGEVIYSISANSGDILNFSLPCDCSVTLAAGVYEGATVLPSDPVLTFHQKGETRVQVEAMLSVEGLSRAVNGENVAIVLSDGRVVPVTVVQSSATNAAAQKGDIYLPVSLEAPQGVLTAADIGKPARVRLTRTLPFLKFFKEGARS